MISKITKVLKTSQQNKSDTVTNENDKEIPQEISKERQKDIFKRKLLIIGILNTIVKLRDTKNW